MQQHADPPAYTRPSKRLIIRAKAGTLQSNNVRLSLRIPYIIASRLEITAKVEQHKARKAKESVSASVEDQQKRIGLSRRFDGHKNLKKRLI